MSAFLLYILGSVCLACQLVSADSEFVEVDTSVGRIRGAVKLLEDGKKVNQYFGIPYAKPPIGELRWKETVPVERWDGVLDASKLYPPHCPQIKFPEMKDIEFKFTVPGPQSEDCLYLNIYTPAYATPKSKLSVLFAIHGGAFRAGTAMNGDRTIVAAYTDVVIVTINYRLGILGFLNFPGSEYTGNYGMFDQITALKWVKDNIVNFGGDPGSITIYGCSAGGVSVSLLTLSPLSKGLFQRAISQSGAAAANWAVNEDKEFGFLKEFGPLMNCTGGLENVRACLQEKTPDELLKEHEKIQMKYPVSLIPQVDGKFLVEHPMKSLANGNIHDVDQMIGVCKDEGDSLVIMMKVQMGVCNDSLNLDSLVSSEPQILKDAIKHEYASHGEKSYPEQNLRVTADFINDNMFQAAAVKTAELVAKAGKNVHYYVFAHRNKMSVYPDWVRVPHGDEVAYTLGTPFNISSQTFYTAKGFTDMERGLSMAVMRMWSNFARSGNPSVPEDDIDWPKFTNEDPAYLEITLDPTVKRGLKTRGTAFWNDYIPQLRTLLKEEEDQPTEEKTGDTKDEL